MDVFCGCEYVSVHNNKNTPSAVWACNEGGDLQRESAFFWVLASILVHIPFYLLLLGWYGGRCSSGGRDHLSPGPGRDGQDGTGWDKTRHDRAGQERKTQVCTGRRRPKRTGQDKLRHIPGNCDWLSGTDQPFQLLSVSHYCGNLLAKQHEIK